MVTAAPFDLTNGRANNIVNQDTVQQACIGWKCSEGCLRGMRGVLAADVHDGRRLSSD